MNVSLTKELESLVNRKVKSGMYQTASEVVREGLRLLKERDQLDWLRKEIRIGFEEIDRGECDEYDESTVNNLKADIRARGMARLAAAKKRKS